MFQQLLLQAQSLLELFATRTVFRFCRLVLEPELGIPAVLRNDDTEHAEHRKHDEQRLYDASLDDSLRKRADLVADDAFPDQVGQKPIGSLDRHIAQGLADAVVRERDLTPVPLGEIFDEHIVGIPVLVFGMTHCLEQVILDSQTPQDGVAEGDAISRVDVAERGIAVR